MLSSPVAGSTYNDLIGDFWTQGENITGANTNDPQFLPNVFTWPLGFANSWISTIDLGSTIPAGQGFLMTVYEIDDINTGVGSFPKTISVTGSEAVPPISVTDGGGQPDGWLLLGNPFKDPISITELFNRADNLLDVVYVWDRGMGPADEDTNPGRQPGWRWAINDPGDTSIPENPILGSLGQTVLMPFQGFFMQKAATGASTVTFDASADGSGSETLRTNAVVGDIFFRKDVDVPNVLVLNLNGENLENSLWLRFSENGSLDRLSNDALELASYNEHFAHFATKKSDGTLLTQAQLPIPGDDFELPVTLETTRPGSYTISAEDFDLTFAQDLYLIDTELNESVRIVRNLSYTFTINQAAKANPSPEEAMLRGPQKVTTEFSDRFLITTQPREMDSTLPDAVALNQNYPNPFNPTTQIRYELPQQSDVRITVYDMVGRQVATLVNESVQAGTHTVNFDASNLSSGIYLYRLQAGNTMLSRKLTVIK